MSAAPSDVMGLGLRSGNVYPVHLNRDSRGTPGVAVLESIVVEQEVIAKFLNGYLVCVGRGRVGIGTGVDGFVGGPIDGLFGVGIPVSAVVAHRCRGGGVEVVRVGKFLDEDGCLMARRHGHGAAARLLKGVDLQFLSGRSRNQTRPVGGAFLVAVGVAVVALLGKTTGDSGTVQLYLQGDRPAGRPPVEGYVDEDQILARCVQSDFVPVCGVSEAAVLAARCPLEAGRARVQVCSRNFPGGGTGESHTRGDDLLGVQAGGLERGVVGIGVAGPLCLDLDVIVGGHPGEQEVDVPRTFRVTIGVAQIGAGGDALRHDRPILEYVVPLVRALAPVDARAFNERRGEGDEVIAGRLDL